MSMYKHSLLIFLVTLCSCSEKQSNKTNVSPSASNFSSMLDQYHEDRLKLFPLEATAAGDARYNDLLPNYLIAENRDKLSTFYKDNLKKINEVDRSKLTDKEKISIDVLKWECSISLEELEFPTHQKPIDQMWSTNLMIGQLASGASTQPFDSVKDYKNWLKRLESYVGWCQSAIANMEEGIKSGVLLPKSLVKKVIPQMEDLAKGPVEEHLFYSPVKNFPENFTAEEKKELTDAYAEMVGKKIIPQYQALAAFFKGKYLAAARTSSGIDAVPNGYDS